MKRFLVALLILFALLVVAPASAQDVDVTETDSGTEVVIVQEDASILGISADYVVVGLMAVLLALVGFISLNASQLRRAIPVELLPVLLASRDVSFPALLRLVRSTPSTADDKMLKLLAELLGYEPNEPAAKG